MRTQIRALVALRSRVMLSRPLPQKSPRWTCDTVERFADLALRVHPPGVPEQDRPRALQSDDDVAPPRELTPAFYGCFDWHSSVHGHWLLTRLSKLYPDAEFSAAAKAGLGRSLSQENSPATPPILPARGGPPTSVPTDWPGCSVWPRSSTPGTTRTRSSGRRTWRRSKLKLPNRIRAGSPSSTTRSAPASTARRPLLSV